MAGTGGGGFGIVTMMKDEGPRLLEWVAYHRLIGFDAIWVYSNDCRDGSDAMLDRLAEMGLLHHLRNRVPEGRKPQPHALTQAHKNPEIVAHPWLIVMDADEFVHVSVGDGSVGALIAACPPDVTGVAVNWRMMGSNGREAWSDAALLSQFTRGAPDGFRRGWGVKTLFRPFENLRLGIHRPTVNGAKRDPDRMAALRAQRWVNGSGQPMPPGFLESGWRGSAATVGYGLAEIAHFAVQSREAYLLRADRGNVNLKPDKYDAGYFAIFDRNETDRPGLCAWSDRVQAVVGDWLCDPGLAALHDGAVAWHRARLAALRERPGWVRDLAALERAAEVPFAALDTVLFTQPLAPAGRRMVARMRAQGVGEAEIARAIAQSVSRLEAARDAREAAELRAMGVMPAAG